MDGVMTASDGCLAWAVDMCRLLDEIEKVARDDAPARESIEVRTFVVID